MSYEFAGPRLTEEENAIAERLIDCGDNRRCVVAWSILMQSVIEDGIIYEGNHALIRVADSIERRREEMGFEPSELESCEGSCALAKLNLHKTSE